MAPERFFTYLIIVARATENQLKGQNGYVCKLDPTPFWTQAAHAIFVREHAEQTFPDIEMVPELFESRLISIRAFDDRAFMVAADVVDGSGLTHSIPALLQDTKVAYLHLHNAKLGCFMARVTRA